MDSSHAWHPGNRAVNSCWPVRTALLPDELFSSWLCRAALRQGCSPASLANSLWPGWRAWTVDIDRSIDSLRLEAVARPAGLLPDVLTRSTLQLYASRLGIKRKRNGLIPWFLPTGARNVRRRCGPMFCADCLNEEPAYFRVAWRFAWHTCCARHTRLLDDRCPSCAAPAEPHRLAETSMSLFECARCHGDLRRNERQPAPRDLILFQSILDDLACNGSLTYAGSELDTASGFTLVRSMINLVRSAAVSSNHDSLIAFLTEIGLRIDCHPSPRTGLPFELLPVDERANLLEAAWHLMSIEPYRFGDGARGNGIADLLAGSLAPCPPTEALSAWGLQPIGTTPHRHPRTHVASPPPVPRHRIERAWARFKRRHNLS